MLNKMCSMNLASKLEKICIVHQNKKSLEISQTGTGFLHAVIINFSTDN